MGIKRIKSAVSVIGFLAFFSSLVMIILEDKSIKRSNFLVEVKGGEVNLERSYMYGVRAILSDDIAYAQGSLFQFDVEKLGNVRVEADRSIYNMKKGEVELIGNVKFKSDKIYMEAKRAKVFIQGGKIVKIEGEEGIYIKDGVREARSRKITIFPEEKKAVLTGNPEIVQGRTKIRGKEITFYIGSDEVEVKKLEAEM